MKGCRLAGVERVVVTSSTEAIESGEKEVFTVDDWSNVDKSAPY